MASRPLSPAARNLLRDGCLVGAGLLVLLVLASLGSWVGAPLEHPGRIVWTALLLAGSAPLVVAGVRARRAAAAFNRRDDAFADALTHQLDQLRRHGRTTAYEAGPDAAELGPARLVVAERHFDLQTTVGTTRASAMGDAVLAVVEAEQRLGCWDTFRVVTPSAAGTCGWVSDLVGGAAHRLGGATTHAGSTVLGWRPALVEAFRPADVSYVSDRLTVLGTRPPGQREPLHVHGSWVGRNALLAASVRLGAEPPLRVMPLGFPALLDRAVGTAAAESDRALTAPAQVRPLQLR